MSRCFCFRPDHDCAKCKENPRFYELGDQAQHRLEMWGQYTHGTVGKWVRLELGLDQVGYSDFDGHCDG